MGAALDLLDKRLLVISGKGGVGKTVVSSALGLIAANQGKTVLLVKMDDQGRTAQLFGVPPLGDRIAPLTEGISALNLDPITVVSDYFYRQLRVRRLVKHIVGSRLFQSWFRVSPAIKEMICLGKVWDLVEERSWWRSRPVWDLVIFDAPATGHGLGLLQLPQQASKLLLGPLRTSALGVQALLENPRTTALALVTLPEEMPVNETVHFYEEAQAKLKVPLRCVFLNAAAPARVGADEVQALEDIVAAGEAGPQRAAVEALVGQAAPSGAQALLTAARTSLGRRSLTERYAAELRRRVDLPLVELPFLFSERFGIPQLELLAAILARELGIQPPEDPA